MTMVFCLSMITGICLAFILPRVYVAKTSILISLQDMPDAFTETDSAIVSQSVTRDEYLRQAMEEAELFSEPKYEYLSPDEKIMLVRRNISVDVESSPKDISLIISFKGSSPEKIVRAGNFLAEHFIREKIRGVTENLRGANGYLHKELETRKNEISLLGNALKEYRTEFKGELSKDLNGNLEMLTKLRAQLSQKQKNLSNKKNRLIQLEGKRGELRRKTDIHIPQIVPETSFEPEKSEDELKSEALKKEYARLAKRYTQRHPDVIRIKLRMAESEAKAAGQIRKREERKRSEKQKKASVEKKRSLAGKALETVKKQYEALGAEIRTDKKNISKLKQHMRVYERRIERTPKREQDISDLEMAYKEVRDAHQGLMNKKKRTDAAVLEWQQTAEARFHISAQKEIPRHPVSPDIRKIFSLSLKMGLGFALGLLVLTEFIGGHIPPKPEHSGDKTVIRVRDRIFNVLLILMTLLLFAGFGFLSMKGTAYVEHIRDIIFPGTFFESEIKDIVEYLKILMN